MKNIIAYILLVAVIVSVILFGASCTSKGNLERLLNYMTTVSKQIEVPSLMDNIDFHSGFKEASYSVAYLIAFPWLYLWSLLQFFCLTLASFGGAI